MKNGIFFRGGFDLEVYVSTFLHYMTGESDVLEDALYDFVYSQNYYFGKDMQIHKYI